MHLQQYLHIENTSVRGRLNTAVYSYVPLGVDCFDNGAALGVEPAVLAALGLEDAMRVFGVSPPAFVFLMSSFGLSVAADFTSAFFSVVLGFAESICRRKRGTTYSSSSGCRNMMISAAVCH